MLLSPLTHCLSCRKWTMVVFIFIRPKKPIKIQNDSIWKKVRVSKPTCHFKKQMKHRIRLEWKPADRRKKLGGKSDISHFLKRMILTLYAPFFIIKEIRTMWLHTPKREEREIGGGGWRSDWKGNLERYFPEIPRNKGWKDGLLSSWCCCHMNRYD